MAPDRETTREAFVIGYPVEHSFSPKLHEYWLNKYVVAGTYEAISLPPKYLAKTLRKLTANYVGGNVTIPHKEKVMLLCDEIDQTALAVGAVNTLTFTNEKIKGYNTDVYGFTENLRHGGTDFSIIHNALVLGAGGAARAVIIALMKQNIRVAVANRTFARAEKLAHEFGCGIYNWNEVEKHLGEFQLLINTTSQGMKGEKDLAIDLTNLPSSAVVADLVYNPLETGLLKQARHKGLKTVDGLGMLLYQAVEGFEMWFGVRPEVTDELREYMISQLSS